MKIQGDRRDDPHIHTFIRNIVFPLNSVFMYARFYTLQMIIVALVKKKFNLDMITQTLVNIGRSTSFLAGQTILMRGLVSYTERKKRKREKTVKEIIISLTIWSSACQII